ncbi:AAA family ATPase [Cytobacillus oceanisediminis]|uniref:AAA family ATPase n=1 Tax=Cytobacillus TaxID=2675230 RepID=UPI001C2420BD|nr:AAA family ATPase [Cytobacillus oceanisediminis]MBU8729861.1 AAA family ATPase [Cytobacillus oceanisediminis]MCM3243022.1 AAA family ATPase [Cytobacillus oceanisediminis]
MLIYFLASSGDRLDKQDINFDSEFHIAYDQVTKELSIKKNYNYIENFWSKNIISLSAIVGKNGVGKSSILELLKDRFFRGLGIANETILIYKEQEDIYKLYYNEGLFNEGILKINGKNYNANSYIFETNESPLIKIDELDLSIQLFKAPSKGEISKNKLLKLEFKSRMAQNFALINYTYYWNYSKRLRSLDIESNTKGLEYFDYSIANKLDIVLRDKYKPEQIIVDIENIYKINSDQRFGINYLYQLNENDIYRVLNYLKNEKNRELLMQYFMVPEELYIYYDYLDSEKRANSFLFDLNDTNEYLRYEDMSKNYQHENLIYDFLLKGSPKKIQLREALLLRIYDSFFTEIQAMVSSEDIQKNIRTLDKTQLYTENSIQIYEDLKVVLDNFKTLVILAIEKAKTNEIMKQKNKERLIENFKSLYEGYNQFLNFIEDEFCKTVESVTVDDRPYFEKDINGTVSVGYRDIEIPKIMLDNKGIELAITLFNKYKNIGTNNKILYFVWRNLSSGETNILNILTSLNTAIEKSKNKYLLILLDEAEVSLHPTWQKNYIKLLVDNIGAKAEEDNKKVQIILTTHSPFVLSDIPSDRVVFLDEKPITKKIYTKKSLDDQPLTFGSNIHDLYMNSFFLEGGLMGDYAKQKINEIANKLINYNPKQKQEIEWEDIRKFINQIGEPIIRTRLVEIYDQKRKLNQDFIPNNVEDTISKIQNEIKKLQSEIRILKESGDET